jgi:antitoxin component of MazEF toxin-antitoxin module
MNNLIFLKKFLGKYPNTTIKTWGNSSGLSQREIKRLIRWGIVKNNGAKRSPNWVWSGGEPTEKMYNRVFSTQRVYKKKRKARTPNTKGLFDILMKYPNIKVQINKDIVVEVRSADDITISRNNTRLKVENLTMLENILSLTA